MADRTTIEWTRSADGTPGSTWNPLRGCTRVSPGCGGPGKRGGCYAEGMAARFSKPGQWGHGFAEMTASGPRWTGKVEVHWPSIDMPLRWTRPRLIFANSTSDLFHKDLPMEEIATIFAVAVAAHHLRGHTFQILTKRADRMREVLNDERFWDHVNGEATALIMERVDPHARRSDDARATHDENGPDDPPPGIWLGVSVEDQQRADERIPHLLASPAAVRFISAEPLLGPIDLKAIDVDGDTEVLPLGTGWLSRLEPGEREGPRLDWIIAGGESGPNARPAHPDWFRSMRDQCAAAGVPFFFKQWGEWLPCVEADDGERLVCSADDGRDDDRSLDGIGLRALHRWPGQSMWRVGKKAAGRLLDGRKHNGMPGIA